MSVLTFIQNFFYCWVDGKIVNISENTVLYLYICAWLGAWFVCLDDNRTASERWLLRKLWKQKRWVFVAVTKQTLCCRLSLTEMKSCSSRQQQTAELKLRKLAGFKTARAICCSWFDRFRVMEKWNPAFILLWSWKTTDVLFLHVFSFTYSTIKILLKSIVQFVPAAKFQKLTLSVSSGRALMMSSVWSDQWPWTSTNGTSVRSSCFNDTQSTVLNGDQFGGVPLVLLLNFSVFLVMCLPATKTTSSNFCNIELTVNIFLALGPKCLLQTIERI